MMMPQTLDLMERRAANCRQSRGEPCMSCKHVLTLVAEVRRLTKPYVIDSKIYTAPAGTVEPITWRMVAT